jgi:Na+-translocating ferredoxin:NAD+ oxidoreductase RnfE subunit
LKELQIEGRNLDRSLAEVVVYGIAPLVALAVRFDIAVIFALLSGGVIFLTAVFLFIVRDLVKSAWLLAYTMIGSGLLVTVIEIILGLFAPEIKQLIGLYLPVLAVSPLVLSQVDGDLDAPLGEQLGKAGGLAFRFLLLMGLTAGIREVLSDGSLTVLAELPVRIQLLVPGLSEAPLGFLASAGGGLILAGFLLALRNWLMDRKARKSGELTLEDEA